MLPAMETPAASRVLGGHQRPETHPAGEFPHDARPLAHLDVPLASL
jgi:hypothetical protein